jgi:hypothetical protein
MSLALETPADSNPTPGDFVADYGSIVSMIFPAGM